VDVLFDLNGTLLDPDALTATWPGAARDLGRSVLDLAVAQAMSDTMSGEFRPFAVYIRAALVHRAAVAGLGDEHVEAGMAAARALPPFPDATAAVTYLAEAGHRVSVLTNSAEDAAQEALRAAGLDAHLHAVIGADGAGAYKPDLRVYRHALDRLEAAAGLTWLVAAHWWDVTGAKREGLRTAWVGRDEGVLLETVPYPDVTGPGLVSVANAIVAAAD
jgi:2-haloacid dehalogenase